MKNILSKVLVVWQHICYHTGMKSEEKSGVTCQSPQTFLNQCGPAWSASNTYQYTENAWGSQCPADGMSLPITSHCWPGAGGSRGRKGDHRCSGSPIVSETMPLGKPC